MYNLFKLIVNCVYIEKSLIIEELFFSFYYNMIRYILVLLQ